MPTLAQGLVGAAFDLRLFQRASGARRAPEECAGAPSQGSGAPGERVRNALDPGAPSPFVRAARSGRISRRPNLGCGQPSIVAGQKGCPKRTTLPSAVRSLSGGTRTTQRTMKTAGQKRYPQRTTLADNGMSMRRCPPAFLKADNDGSWMSPVLTVADVYRTESDDNDWIEHDRPIGVATHPKPRLVEIAGPAAPMRGAQT